MELGWKIIPDTNGMYEASNFGEIRNAITGQMLKKYKSRKGYYMVSSKNLPSRMVHRLVAMAWIKNTYNLPYINHLDGNKINNCIDNIEWISAHDNNIHCYQRIKIHKRKPNIKNEIIRIDPKTGDEKVFNTLTAAAKSVNRHYSCIQDALKGVQKTSAGYIWKYMESDQKSLFV